MIRTIKNYTYLLPLIAIIILLGCTTKNGPGRYELKVKDQINLDQNYILEYSSYDKQSAGFFTLYKDNKEIARPQTCEPRESDIIDFYRSREKLAPFFVYTYNPNEDQKCFVDIFRKKEFVNNQLELGNYEGFECGNMLVGFVFKKGGTNPYELHGFNTVTAQRQVDFASKGNEVVSCSDMKINIENLDEKNKKIILAKE